jgi:glycosyltransferase involved in cell wall biosynthesis
VAFTQRIIPHYRVPVFTELSKREYIDLTVYYGKGFPSGSSANADYISGFKHKKLATIFLGFLNRQNKQLIVFHPFLFFHLLFGRYEVVIAEPTTNIFNDLVIFPYCKLFRKKFIWYEAGAVPKPERTRNRKLMDPVVGFITKRADAYITYNSFAEKYLIESFKIPVEKIFRAQNALDTNEIVRDIAKYENQVTAKRKEYGLDGVKVALFIGGIEKRKRINNLISAINNINKNGINAKALIVGDGQDLEWVKDNMNPDEAANTIFAGKHVLDAVLFILLSDVVVLPAQGGLSINHAFACGKPFIGTREGVSPGTDSIYDYVTDGYNGYVVKENDIADLEVKLEAIFTNPELYDKLSKGASETSKRINVPGMVNGIENSIKYSVRNRNGGHLRRN